MARTHYNILVFIVLLIFSGTTFSQVKIIFDTDFGGDADDLGALVMLHNFIDQEECELLGIMSSSNRQYAVPAINATNIFYNHPNIPIGTLKGEAVHKEWFYDKAISDRFHYDLDFETATNATILYRQLLANSSSSSITIVTVGPLINIQNLIKSEADSISSLTGKELIEQKVKEFVIMGGWFPSGKEEWNFFGEMPGVTKFVIENLPIPITFSCAEVGVDIKTGEVFNQIDKQTPLYVGFLHFSNNAPWMKEFYTGAIIDNATYDQTAILYAVRSSNNTYWNNISGWHCKPDNIGGNIWEKQENSNHSYLKLIMNVEDMATLIESIMLNEF